MRIANDVVYAVGDLSSIGSESAYGEDIPSDVSIGSEASTLRPVDMTIRSLATSEISLDLGYDHDEYDSLPYESDLQSESDERDDDLSLCNHLHSLDFSDDDELSLVSDDYDTDASFSDDEDEDGMSVISESSRFERTLRLQLALHEENAVPSDVTQLSVQNIEESVCNSSAYEYHDCTFEESPSAERLKNIHASKIINRAMSAGKSGVPGICSLNTSLRLQRTLFRIPSRSVSLDNIAVRL